MESLNPADELARRIARQEEEKSMHLKSLKLQLHHTGQSLKPASLVKGAVMELTESTQIKSILWKAALGLAVGYAASRLVSKPSNRKSKSPFKGILQLGVDALASQKYKILQAAGVFVARQIWMAIRNRQLQKQEQEQQEQQTIGQEHTTIFSKS